MLASTYMFISERLAFPHFDRLARCGISGVEVFCFPGHFDWHGGKECALAAEASGATGVAIHSFHAPWDEKGSFDIATSDRRRRRSAMEEMRRAMDCLAELGGAVMVMHPGYSTNGETSRSDRLETALAGLHELAAYGRGRGITIAIENACPDDPGCEAHEWLWLSKQLATDGIVSCLDTGHATLATGGLEAFVVPSCVPAQLHLSDNSGTNDDHLVPGEGVIDWRLFFQRATGSWGDAFAEIAEVLEIETCQEESKMRALSVWLSGFPV